MLKNDLTASVRGRHRTIAVAIAAAALLTLPAARAEAVVQPVFGAPVNSTVGDGPFKAATADFNADLIPDLAVANFAAGTVSVLRGDGLGGFAAPATLTAGTQPAAVAAADFNGDGRSDLAVANAGSNDVSVLLNDGAGGFGAATSLAVGSNPRSVTVARIDGDAIVDLVVANRDTNNVSVLLGTGTGAFGAAINSPGGPEPLSVQAGDFNGDAINDLAIANKATDKVAVIRGNGVGGFGSPIDLPVGDAPVSVTIADLDGDLDLDIAAANFDSDSVSVLRGDGAGAFAAATSSPVGDGPTSVVALDFNLDGRQDLATANFGSAFVIGSSNVSVLPGLGAGAYDPAMSFFAGTGPSWILAANFDGDLAGRPDLAVINETSDNASVLLNGTDTAAPLTTDDVPVAFRNGPVTVTLTAGDGAGSGVDKTYFTVDGSVPTTASTQYSAATQPVLANGQQVRYFSTDVAGNAEAVKTSLAAKVDTAAPVTTDDVPTSFRNAPVTVTLAAADGAGSGVDKTYYTVDGSVPTTASAVYNPAPGSKPVLTNGQRIRYLSVDLVGNAEAARSSAVVQIETSPPATTDNVPVAYQAGPVTVTLTATDTGGSGVDKTYYMVGASPANPTTASTVYSAAAKPVLTDGQRIKYFTVDTAGNQEAVKTSAPARVDTSAPVTTDDVTGSAQSVSVTVTLSATDTGGSGVFKTYYTVGANPPNPTTGSAVYSAAAKPVLTDGQRIKYFSVDVVGNAEAVKTSQVAGVDAVAPVTTDDVPASFGAADVVVTLTANDARSGVDKTYYTAGANPANPTTGSAVYSAAAKPVLTDGQLIRYFSVDRAGNAEAIKTSAAAKVDRAAPVTTDDVPASAPGPVNATLSATDGAGSGVDKTYYTVGANPANPTTGSAVYSAAARPALTDGQRIRYFSVDKAGNAETVKTSGALVITAQNAQPAAPTPPPAMPAAPIGKLPATLQVERVRVVQGKLDVLARINFRATGNVRISFLAAGRTTSFDTAITQNGTIRVTRPLPPGQRQQTTGMMELSYGGSAEVQRDSVRLRAATGRALLRTTKALIADGRVQGAGKLSRLARGVVRVRVGYNAEDGEAVFLNFTTPIVKGAWSLTRELPAAAHTPNQLAIQFTGYAPNRIRGEQDNVQLP